jgi:hypothetical protein
LEAQVDAHDRRVDGNAAGGILAVIFSGEMTTARTVCAGCGLSATVGALHAYVQDMGTVLRCPGCETPLIRIAHHSGAYWLDLRGTACLQIAELPR